MKIKQSNILRIQRELRPCSANCVNGWLGISIALLVLSGILEQEREFAGAFGLCCLFSFYSFLITLTANGNRCWLIIECNTQTDTIRVIKKSFSCCICMYRKKNRKIDFECSVLDLILAFYHSNSDPSVVYLMNGIHLMCTRKPYETIITNRYPSEFHNELCKVGIKYRIHSQPCDAQFLAMFVQFMARIKVLYHHHFEIIDATGQNPDDLVELLKGPMQRAAKIHNAVKADDEKKFTIGEAVEIKWGASWKRGFITNMDPLRVRIEEKDQSVDRSWTEIKKLGH